jgi:ubiquinone/menaquinone biosynthesis C-methylase UbiE
MQMTSDHFDTQIEVQRMHERIKLGLRSWERSVVDQYFHGPGRVLNIGCGAGREAFALTDMGYDVIGIDISEGQISSARETAAARGLDIDFRLCDGEHLEFPEDSFDHIVMWAQGFGYIPCRTLRHNLLTECARVVKPGGIVSVSVHYRPVCDATWRTIENTYSWEDLPEVGMSEGDYLLREETDSILHSFTVEEMTALCTGAGLEVVACRDATTFGGSADFKVILVSVSRKPA